jgi:uncharacterized protein (TIGR00369 family)
MNDFAPDPITPEPFDAAAPAGFQPVPMRPTGTFAHVNGPLYAKMADGKLVVGFRVEVRHCNPARICHGGMLMTFADMLLGMGSNFGAKLGRFLPTVSMACDFMAPAPLGSWVEGSTEVLRVTRNLVFAQCLVRADGTVALRASGTMKLGPAFDSTIWQGLEQALAKPPAGA